MTSEKQTIKNIELGNLPSIVEEYKRNGYRVVQISCTSLSANSFELTYSFDKDYKFENIRITVPKDTEVQSVSGIFKGTFLYENEITEMFGIKFKDIIVDYNGTLFKKKTPTPFAIEEKKG